MDKKEICDFFRLINFGNAKQRATIITLITEDSNDLSCFLNFFKDLKIYIIYNDSYDSYVPNQSEMVNNDFFLYSYTLYPHFYTPFERSDFVMTFSNGIFYLIKNRFNDVKEIDINDILRKEKLDTLLSSF